MKILITGIRGFVGSFLRRTLENEGHDVFGIDITGGPGFVFEVDITDLQSVQQTISNIEPDVIFHLAAISMTDYKIPAPLYSINVSGSINIFTASMEQKIKPRIIFISSSQVYGIVDNNRQPIKENEQLAPVNHYGASKTAVENILRAFHLEHGLPFVIMRPFNHIGRGQNQHFVVPKIIHAFKEKKKNIELGNIKTIRDFLDVRDVVSAYTGLLNDFPDGETFNIASGVGLKIETIINTLEKITGNSVEIIKDESLVRKNEIPSSVGDVSKIKGALSWEPNYSLEETLQWILSDRD